MCHGSGPCPLSQLGRSAPRPHRTYGPKQSSGSCILQRETLLGQQTTAPTPLGSRKQRKQFSPPDPRSPKGEPWLGCPGSLGPAALLGVSGARNPLPTGSPLWGSRIGRGKAFCAQAPALPPEPARPLSAEAPALRRPEAIFWQLQPAKGNSPRAANHSPNAPRIEKATQAVLAPGHPHSIGRTGAGLSRLPGPCCFAGGLRQCKPTPHGFSFVGKQDWAREGLLRPAPAMPLEPARPLSAEAPLHRRPKTSFWELHSAKGNTPPAANHSPNAPRIQRATQAVFAPGPTLSIGQSRAELTLAPWTLLLCWVSP